MTPNGSNDTVTLEIIRASEVTPREVKWLWYPYIPFGKITLLQGDPGDGKSKFMLALSALLTDGKPPAFPRGRGSKRTHDGDLPDHGG